MRLSFVIVWDFVLCEVWSEIEETVKDQDVTPNHDQL